MPPIRPLFSLIPVSVGSLLLSACWGQSYDRLVDCRVLGDDYFSNRARVSADFPRLPLEQKYIVYICGSQAVRPPLMELEFLFADEGLAAVPFLLSKLEETASGETVTDILRVLLTMQNKKLYFVARDEAVMSRIEARTQKLDAGAEKRASEEILSELRAGK